MPEFKKSSGYKMRGFSYPGESPIKLTDEERRANLLKAVPNKEAYDKLSDPDKKGFDEAAKKAGLPTKKSPAKQVEKDKRKGPSYSHYREGTLKALKQVNPVIQGAKLIKETSKATVKGLKERPKKNPSHTGVRKI